MSLRRGVRLRVSAVCATGPAHVANKFAIRSGLAVVVALTALVPGCGSETSPSAASSGSTVIPERQATPLSDYLGGFWADTTPAVLARALEQNWQRRQAIISVCMHEQGFEYDPQGPMASAGGGHAVYAPESHPNDRNWVSQYGFGIVLSEELSRLIWAPPGHDGDANAAGDAGAAAGSAAASAQQGMSDEELEAFMVALHGARGDHGIPGLVLDIDGMSEAEILLAQGCEGRAELEMQSGYPITSLLRSDEFAPLLEAINRLGNEARRVAGPEEIDWAACMADHGHTSFSRRLNPDAMAYLGQIVGDNTLPELRIREQFGSATSNAPERANLLAQEIDLALADFDCRVAVDYDAREHARAVALETQFITDNRSALNALRDATEQCG